MEYRQLGRTDIEVSVICLGTMPYGEQNTESEGHAQMDMALDHGVNFFDTAEMYAVPARAETYGETERIIGTWLKNRNKRDDVVIATKVAGPSPIKHIRGGKSKLDRANIMQAIDGSLQRLQTDYIDLYQVHWPSRKANYFSKLGYVHDENDESLTIAETFDALVECMDTGKVRTISVSNETPWGVMQYLNLSKSDNQRIVSIQNPYSLLNRTFEVGLAEIAHREAVGLLAYSPLGFGTLTGKYLGGQWPDQARLTRFKEFKRYLTDGGQKATQAYVELAKEHGLNPAQMALAYVNSRPFLTSNIIGATTLEQLEVNLNSAKIKLDDSILEEIEKIHTANPNPCP